MGQLKEMMDDEIDMIEETLNYLLDNPPISKSYESILNYTKRCVEAGYKSDGCTFVLDGRFKHVCVMHDIMYQLKLVSRFTADNYMFRGISDHARRHGKKYYIVAAAYWVGLRVANLTGLMWAIQKFR